MVLLGVYRTTWITRAQRKRAWEVRHTYPSTRDTPNLTRVDAQVLEGHRAVGRAVDGVARLGVQSRLLKDLRESSLSETLRPRNISARWVGARAGGRRLRGGRREGMAYVVHLDVVPVETEGYGCAEPAYAAADYEYAQALPLAHGCLFLSFFSTF